jgi:hypothetical protein
MICSSIQDSENVCNASTSADAFNSGRRECIDSGKARRARLTDLVVNATDTFMASVLSSSTQFHYCGVPTHCQKGMFGLIK